jgi:hypothetical protein
MWSVILDVCEWVDIEKRQDCKQLENYFRCLGLTDRRQVIIKENFINENLSLSF